MLNDTEYAKLRKKIKDDCAKEQAERLHALDVAFGKTRSSASSSNGNGHAPAQAESLADAVRQSIEKLPQQFNSNDLRATLSKEFPNIKFHSSTLSHFMADLHKEGERLKIVAKGTGKKPAFYEKL